MAKKITRKETPARIDKRFFAISSLDGAVGNLELLTPDTKYTILNNMVVATEPVENYDAEVRKRMGGITERMLVAKGFFSGGYTVQFNQKVKVKVN